jgi:hypothetical protein
MEKRKFTPAEIYGPKNAMGYPEKTYTVSDIEVKLKRRKHQENTTPKII